MTPEQVITEARARIIWGDSAASVRDYLLSNGISDTSADARLAEFVAERDAERRARGLRDVLTGLLLLVASGGVLLVPLLIYGRSFSWSVVLGGFRGLVPSLIMLVAIVLFGSFKLLRGVFSICKR